jgi:hypothetical protein
MDGGRGKKDRVLVIRRIINIIYKFITNLWVFEINMGYGKWEMNNINIKYCFEI